MRLEAISVKNWRVIDSVEILSLQTPVTVIYAPNGAGKTSLHEAVTVCLFGPGSYRSTSSRIREVVPWDRDAVPEVTVEFRIKKKRYRIKKVYGAAAGYSNRSSALLEELSAGSWRTRGSDSKAESVLQQLLSELSEVLPTLWANQGDVSLPSGDGTLRKRVASLLETFTTPQDECFYNLLTERLSQYFTPKMNLRRNSPIRLLDEKRNELRSQVDERRKQREKIEAAEQQLRLKKLQVEREKKHLEELQGKHEEIQKAVEEIRRKEARFREVSAKVEAVNEALKSAGEELKRLKRHTQTLKTAKQELKRCKVRLQRLVAELSAAKAELHEVAKRESDMVAAKAQTEETLKALKQRESHLKKALKLLQQAADLESKTQDLNSQLRESAAQRQRLEQELSEVERDRERKSRKMREISDQLRGLRSQIARREELERTLTDLRRRQKEAQQVIRQIEEIQKMLSGKTFPSKADCREAEELDSRLRTLQAETRGVVLRLRALRTIKVKTDSETHVLSENEQLYVKGTRLQMRIEDACEVEAYGEEAETTDSLAALEKQVELLRKRFGIEEENLVAGMQRLRVVEEELRKRLKKLRSKLAEISPEGLEVLHRRLTELEAQLGQEKQEADIKQTASTLETEIEVLQREVEDLEQSAKRLRKQLDKNLSKSTNLAVEQERIRARLLGIRREIGQLFEDAQLKPHKEQTGKQIKEVISDLREEMSKKEAEIRQINERCDEERRKHNELTGTVQHLKNQREELLKTIAKLEQTIESAQRELEQLPNQKTLAERLNSLKQEKQRLQRELKVCYLSEDERRKLEEHTKLENALKRVEERLQTLQKQMYEIHGVLKQAEGLHEESTILQTQLNDAEAQYRTHCLRAEALKLLKTLYDELRRQKTERMVEPISRKISDWLGIIGLEWYDAARFDESLRLEALHFSPADIEVSPDMESYGTREQLAMLVRLAFASLLAQEQPLSLVLDDPLAHSDVQRHEAFLRVLEQAVREQPNLHVLILTCHPERFETLPSSIASQIPL